MKGVTAKWFLSKLNDNSIQLTRIAAIETKGIMGIILAPVVKIKFGKLGDELMDDLKYCLGNGSPHPRNFVA
jgi:hypothetical protein